MTNPTDPIPVTSRTEAELLTVEARRTVLLAQLAVEQSVREASPAVVRALAVRFHRAMCMANHLVHECQWYVDPQADHYELADWSEVSHGRWLLVASAGIYETEQMGATITWPSEIPPFDPPPAD